MIFCWALAFLFTGCTDGADLLSPGGALKNAIKGDASVTPATSTLNVGGSVQLKFSVSGNDVSPKWSSSNVRVATVSAAGLVKAVGVGKASISAQFRNLTDTATVTVSSGTSSQSGDTVVYASKLNPGKCITASGTTSGSNAVINDCTNGKAQKFYWNGAELRNGGLCVDAKDGTGQDGDAIILWSCNGGDNQKWSFTSKGELKGINGKCIDIPSSTATNGTGLVLYSCLGGSDQAWLPNGADTTATADPSSSTATHAGFYVAPGGSSGGDGSAAKPWDLQTALNQPSAVQPGDTIWLRGGTYKGQFTSRLNGMSGAPIVVRQYPGERARIDDQLTVDGSSWTWYWGFEVMSSDPNRVSSQTGSHPTDIARSDAGITILHAPNTKYINIVVHDASNGFRFWTAAPDAEIYGAILYNNGWQGPDRGHGHGIYTQNQTGIKRIENVISFNNYSTGMKAYGSGSAYVRGYRILDNTAFNGGSLSTTGKEWNIMVGQLSGGNGVSDVVVSRNVAYHSDGKQRSFELGYMSQNYDLVAEGNYVAGGMAVRHWNNAVVRNNTVTADQWVMYHARAAGQSSSNYSLSGNAYYNASTAAPFQYVVDGSDPKYLTFADWQRVSGLDATSTYSTGWARGLRVIVRPNKYEAGRAHVTVINPAGTASVAVDLSSVLKVGDAYEVRNAQDFYAPPVVTGTYGGGTVSLPMSGLGVAQPIGNAPKPASPTGPTFNVFVVLKK